MYDHLVPYYKDYPMDYRFRGWNNLDGGFRTPIHLSIVLELNQFQQIYCLLINIFLFLELLDSKSHLTSSQISLSKPTHWPGSANCVQQMWTISSPQISWFRYQSSVMMIFSLSEDKTICWQLLTLFLLPGDSVSRSSSNDDLGGNHWSHHIVYANAW